MLTKNHPRKTLLGIDIDNVISDTDQIIREIINNKFGVFSEREQIKSWNYSDSLPISLQQESIALDLFHKEYCKYVTPIYGASSSMKYLYGLSTIWLITGRDPSSEDLTKDWLYSNQIPYDKLFFAKDKIPFSESIDLIIEDNWETTFRFANIGIPAILLNKPWNQNRLPNSLIYRATTWKEIIDLIQELLFSTEN